MATIEQSPSCTLLAAYSPIVWKVQEFTLSNRLAPAIEVVFTVNGTAQPPIELTPIEGFDAPPRYIFEVDAQEVLQSYFDNLAPLPEPGIFVHLYGFTAVVSAVITPYIDEGDAVLIRQDEDALTTNEVEVINAYRRGTDGHCLDAYRTGTYVNTPGQRPWLTRLVDQVELCRNSNFYLSGHNGNQKLIWVVAAFDAQGNQLSAGVFSSDMVSAEQIEVVAVGPVNINQVSNWFGGEVTIDDSVSYYTIGSAYLSLEDEVNVHRTFRIDLSNKCCEYELLFLNSFGVYEILPIGKEDVLTYRVEGETYQSARLLPSEANYLLSREVSYLEKQATNTIQVTLPYTRETYRDWHRDLLNSPDVYLLQNRTGPRIPVNIDTGNFALSKNFAQVLTITWSTVDRSQRT